VKNLDPLRETTPPPPPPPSQELTDPGSEGIYPVEPATGDGEEEQDRNADRE